MRAESTTEDIRVLLVEDNDDDAFIVRDYLGDAAPLSFEVRHHPRLDLALGDDGQADVVLLDLSLPDCGGAETLSRMRDGGNGAPILVLTGLDDHEKALELLHLGADDYLAKGGLTRGRLVRSILFALERRRLSERLREQIDEKRALRKEHQNLERKFGAALRLNGQLIYEMDPARREIRLGDCEDLLGFTADELGHGLDDWVERVHPGDRDEYVRWLRRDIRGDTSGTLEYRLRRKDGSHVFVEDNAYHLPDHGDGDLILGLIHDITRRKELENQFHQSQKMEAVGMLAGGVAHDFNNMLSVIMGYTQFALRKTDGDPELSDYLGEVLQATRQAASLTRQLLTFSRKEVSAPRIVNLNEILEGSQKMLRRLIGERIDLSSGLEPELWNVRIDPGHMEQIVMNLCINARDAMPDGGDLRLSTENTTLDGTPAGCPMDLPPGDYVLLRVRDTGTGIDEQTLARIFEPFFTTKEQGKGTGLGLSTVYGIVEKAGGGLAVRSEVGDGAEFSIYLPRCAEKIEQSLDETTRDGPAAKAATILVVEDEESIRRLCRHALESAGHRVTLSENGEQALGAIEKNGVAPDLLITDMVMPGLTGSQIARKVRARHPGARVLYISGYTDDMIEDLNDHKDIPLLQKPFGLDALKRKVAEMLAD